MSAPGKMYSFGGNKAKKAQSQADFQKYAEDSAEGMVNVNCRSAQFFPTMFLGNVLIQLLLVAMDQPLQMPVLNTVVRQVVGMCFDL